MGLQSNAPAQRRRDDALASSRSSISGQWGMGDGRPDGFVWSAAAR